MYIIKEIINIISEVLSWYINQKEKKEKYSLGSCVLTYKTPKKELSTVMPKRAKTICSVFTAPLFLLHDHRLGHWKCVIGSIVEACSSQVNPQSMCLCRLWVPQAIYIRNYITAWAVPFTTKVTRRHALGAHSSLLLTPI